MNYTRHIVTGLIAAGVLFAGGCSYDKTAAEPPLIRQKSEWASQANFQAQADNAVLTSMTVADIHFVPYRSELNSLGRGRLTAIASYLEQYGGEVIVDCSQGDEMMQQDRMGSVRQFLLGQGLDEDRLSIVSGLTQGRGQGAEEATVFYQRNLFGSDGGSSAGGAGSAAALGAAGGEEK